MINIIMKIKLLILTAVITAAIIITAGKCRHRRLSLTQIPQTPIDQIKFGRNGRFVHCLDCGQHIKFLGTQQQVSKVQDPRRCFSVHTCDEFDLFI